MNDNEFLEQVYKHIQDEDRRIDFIFEYMDDLWYKCHDNNKDFTPINTLLEQVDVKKLSIASGLAFLTINYANRNEIPAYKNYYDKLKQHFTEIESERVNALLWGLDP